MDEIQKEVPLIDNDTGFAYNTGTEFNLDESKTFYPQGTQ
jgi:hypothetical protein